VGALAGGTGRAPSALNPRLVSLLRRIEAVVGPVHVVSGCRTRVDPRVPRSRHLTCEAADIVARTMLAGELHTRIRAAYVAGLLPGLGGLGRYAGHVHVDVRPGRLVEWEGNN
jgi:uncharacterized protein YcbK (DUF882 family)